MMYARYFGALLLSILLANSSYAQKKLIVFEFQDELCTYEAYYDSDKFSEAELVDTYLLTQFALYFTGEDIESLENEKNILIEELMRLKLVKHPVFLSARDSMLRYANESYEIQKLRIQAISDPRVLYGKFNEDVKVKQYADALNKKGDLLLQVYKDLVLEQMKNNGYPEGLWARYEQNVKSVDRIDIAFDYVLTYGWWNHVNHLIYHYTHDGTLSTQFHELFDKLITIDCDEP